jgi:RHS repeat-associated protein
MDYNILGQRDKMFLGNGTVIDYNYDPTNFRLNQITTTGPGSTVLQNLTYTYDPAGNVASITDVNTPQNNQNFVYDHLDRLTSATGPYGSSGAQATLNYAYDSIGNLLCNSQLLSTCSAASPNYTYPANGLRPHAVTQVQTAGGSWSYTYDAAGNMITGAERSFTYDAENRLTKVTTSGGTTQMEYDYAGSRVKKTANGSSTTYIHGIMECTPSGCAKYYFVGETRVALKDAFGQVYYYHTDHLGSSAVVTNASGAEVQRLAYFPFGKTRTNSGSFDVHHKYTGQEFDDSSNLYFYNARYYDQDLGRFIQPDTMGVSYDNPQTLNRYSYVLNNPLRYTDPTGNLACDGFFSCIGAGFSAVGSAIVDGAKAVGRAFNDYIIEPTSNLFSGGGSDSYSSRPAVPTDRYTGAGQPGTSTGSLGLSQPVGSGGSFGAHSGGPQRSQFSVLFRGGFGTSGSGENVEALAAQLNARGQPAVVLNPWQTGIGKSLSKGAASTGFIGGVNLMGHSFGATAAVTTAQNTPSVRFNNLFTVDAVGCTVCNNIPSNVNTNFNFYQTNWWFPHGRVNQGPGNIQNRYVPGVNHFGIMDPNRSSVPGFIYNTIIGP